MPVIEDAEADTKALTYVQIDNQIKELEDKKAELRDTLLGITGVTKTGLEIKWTTVQSNTVDKEAVEKALGFVPTKQGKESVRLSIKPTGGNN